MFFCFALFEYNVRKTVSNALHMLLVLVTFALWTQESESTICVHMVDR